MAWTDKKDRLVCGCNGYWFPHRKGSRHCEHHPMAIYWSVIRQGGDHLDAVVEQMWEGKSEIVEGLCPF